MKKILLTLVVAVILILALASCKPNNRDDTNSDNQAGNQQGQGESNGDNNNSQNNGNNEIIGCSEHNYVNNICSNCGCSLWNGTADTSWYNVAELEFNISTAEQLAGLSQLANSGIDFNNTTINLLADIDLAEKEWTPIGTGIVLFDGIFEGNGHKISNYRISSVTMDRGLGFLGLFGGFSGVINDITVSDFNIRINFADLSDPTYGTIYVGGVVAGSQGGEINGCYSIGDIQINGVNYDDGLRVCIGGISGTGGEKVSNCIADVDILCIDCGNNIGGLIGYASNTLVEKSYSVSNIVCQITGVFVEAGNYEDISVGGLIGGIGNSGMKSTVKNCFSIGDVSVTANKSCYLGGLVGCLTYGSTISNSYSTANITGHSSYVHNYWSFAGGLVGGHSEIVNKDRIDAKNCWASGNVALTVDCGNGVVGYLCGGYLYAENCFYSSEALLSDNTNTYPNSTPARTEDFKNAALYTNKLLWDKEIWDYESGDFPTLRNNR